MKYVIIGGGAASIGAIEGIRSVTKEGEITVVTREEFLPYSRPGISYWLSGKLPHAATPLRDLAFFERNGVRAATGGAATGVDTEKKIIVINEKGEIPYDRLLIATGGTPIIPPIKGLEKIERVFSFTTARDAMRIAAARERIRRAVILGGGLIGLKAAEALFDMGIAVTVLELSDHILASVLDENASRIVRKHLEGAGFEIITGDSVKSVEEEGNGELIMKTEKGKTLLADALIIAIGVRPDLTLARNAAPKGAIAINRGILADDYLMTSAPDVYVAGDVAEAYDVASGTRRVTPILPNAHRQGMAAGRNMAGARERYEGGLPMNAIGFYGLDTVSIGRTLAADQKDYSIRSRIDEKRGTYRALAFSEGKLVGALLVSDVERSGVFSGLIRDGVFVSGIEETMLQPDFGMIHLEKSTREERLRRK